MSYKCSFLDNEVYGSEDVSAAFSRILSSGVLAYPEAETVQEALNTLTAEVVGDGVAEYGGLEVSLTEAGAKVGKGAAFFESGVAVEVDSDGAEVSFENGMSVYISFVYYPELNSVVLKATETIPDGDAVVLGYVDAEGNLLDKRSYAQAKVAINTSNVYHDFKVHHTATSRNYNNPINGSQSVYHMPHNAFRYLILKNADLGSFNYAPVEHVIDLNKEGVQYLVLNDGYEAMVGVEKNGTDLKITSIYPTAYNERTYEFTLA